MERYQRQILLNEMGEEGQKKLSQATVLVIGAGGLGNPVLSYLSAIGVGKLVVVDNDLVSESNLNRQVLFTSKDVGKPKVEIAAKKIRQQNPKTKVEAHAVRFNLENALEWVKSADVAVDCSDNVQVRYLLNDACQIAKRPMVFAGIYKFQIQLSVFHGKSKTSYRDLYPYREGKAKPATCNEVGVLGTIPGILGTMQANETVKVLLNIGEPLDGKVFYLDTLTFRSQIFGIKKISKQVKKLEALPEYKELCYSENQEISVEDFLSSDDCDLIDIRSSEEEPTSAANTVPIENVQKKKVVLMCKSGKRSLEALKEFRRKYPEKEFYSLKGGVLELNKALEHSTLK